MQEIVECVMNISEGRVVAKIDAIANRIRSHSNSFLLNISSDPDHHRTVFSFIGTPASISDAAFARDHNGRSGGPPPSRKHIVLQKSPLELVPATVAAV